MIALEALITKLEAERRSVEWGMDGPVSENRPGDPGWWLRVDGEVVATGDP